MRKIVSVFGLLMLAFSFALPAEAHVLQTDGTIGAVMHVDPDDDPIAGQPSSFFFEFKDTTNRFQQSNCDCSMSIYEGGTQLFSQPFPQTTQANLNTAAFQFTFPQKDVYTVKITGKPLQTSAFQPFTLTYNVRVAREADANTLPTTTDTNWFSIHAVHIIEGGIIVLIFIGAVFVYLRRAKTMKKS